MLKFVSTHSRAEAAALNTLRNTVLCCVFQHTAARRRLPIMALDNVRPIRNVSTHSRAEAAAVPNMDTKYNEGVSTHSRAEAAADER